MWLPYRLAPLLPAPVIHSDHRSGSVSHSFQRLSETGAGCGMLGLESLAGKPRSLCHPVCTFAGLCSFWHTNCTWNCPFSLPHLRVCQSYVSSRLILLQKTFFFFFFLEFRSPSPNTQHYISCTSLPALCKIRSVLLCAPKLMVGSPRP